MQRRYEYAHEIRRDLPRIGELRLMAAMLCGQCATVSFQPDLAGHTVTVKVGVELDY